MNEDMITQIALYEPRVFVAMYSHIPLSLHQFHFNEDYICQVLISENRPAIRAVLHAPSTDYIPSHLIDFTIQHSLNTAFQELMRHNNHRVDLERMMKHACSIKDDDTLLFLIKHRIDMSCIFFDVFQQAQTHHLIMFHVLTEMIRYECCQDIRLLDLINVIGTLIEQRHSMYMMTQLLNIHHIPYHMYDNFLFRKALHQGTKEMVDYMLDHPSFTFSLILDQDEERMLTHLIAI